MEENTEYMQLVGFGVYELLELRKYLKTEDISLYDLLGFLEKKPHSHKVEHRNEKEDIVNHPDHYTSHPSGIECIQVTEHMNFLLGSAVKYIWRQGLKDDRVQDLKKAVWYIQREIERLEKTDSVKQNSFIQWSKQSDKCMTCQDAIEYCENLREDGYDNWRLPTDKELIGLRDSCNHDMKSVNYWCYGVGTPCFSSNSLSFYVDFKDGRVYLDVKKNKFYVRAVRNKKEGE
ncbi:MAG: DUF3310 domain-containing protein [Clostridia bacterium]|nr:DUF3310 domain-containing protein [Clostridia bacterium]